jgi:hypothetical protein
MPMMAKDYYSFANESTGELMLISFPSFLLRPFSFPFLHKNVLAVNYIE